MAAELNRQLEQAPVEDPLAQDLSNADVFRAAVKALGSNSRAWATFLKVESQLSNFLGDYDPTYTHYAFEAGNLSIDDLKSCRARWSI